jgi:hypothetical protein
MCRAVHIESRLQGELPVVQRVDIITKEMLRPLPLGWRRLMIQV